MSDRFTPVEDAYLRECYPTRGLIWCAEKLARTKPSIRQRASELKLKLDKNSEFFKEFQKRAAQSKVGKKRPAQAEVMRQLHRDGKLKQTPEHHAKTGAAVSNFFKENGHPRGALGMKHSESECRKISARSKQMWADPNHFLNSADYRQSCSDRMMTTRAAMPAENSYSKAKRGRRDDLDEMYFRSKWEANYARYLNWMKIRGEIYDWKYETKTFWFDAIKRGVRSYKPDFEVLDAPQSTPRYVEVKGWMDPKSTTKIKRMAKYYPTVKLDVFTDKDYRSLKRSLGSIIPGWEA